MINKLQLQLIGEEKGQATTEYGIIITIVAISAILVLVNYSVKIGSIFELIKNSLIGN